MQINRDEFWRWAYSDFLANASRGVLAEYFVAKAIGCELTQRAQWDDFDLLMPDGCRVEVKSSAYLQTWAQSKLSSIRFDIAERAGMRCADIYVFSLLAAKQRPVDPLDTCHWTFFVCATEVLNRECGGQKSISLSSLERLGLLPIPYEKLRDSVTALAKNSIKAKPLRGSP